ncbi:MAG: MotA/TolQ/ExbB proton channel family protein [Verrucomicrobia bacterium]|nr:MotA/TolQ/ExbB proton channel family protein [Verrucomicrobiota bacterium]
MKTRKLLPFALGLSLLLLAASTGLAEEGAAAPAQETLFETIKNGGALIMTIWLVILGTSATMVTLVIQNFFTLRAAKLAPPTLVESLTSLIAAGNYQEAWETCNANENYIANVLKAGLSRLGRGKEAVEDALSEHGLREATLIRTRNSYLSVIGVVSPMIGLLGTVIGMIGAFSVLAGSGISDPRALSGKIGEVLIATASGLFIAIPAFVFYYIFRNRAQMAIVHADDVVNTLVRDLPYEELAGVKIGEAFSSGTTGAVEEAGQSRKVSVALSTNCPICNGAIDAGQNPCPHCGATLQWQQ